MKNLLMLFLVFLAFQNSAFADALKWGDLELNSTYHLKQEINFDGVAKFKAGDSFEVLDSISEDGPVIVFLMHFKECQNPDLTSEMILVNPMPEDTSRDRSVGIELKSGCNLQIYLEPRDFYSSSLFNE
jgi:hypothetical protein